MRVTVKDRLVQGAVAFLAMFALISVITLCAYSDFNGLFFLQFTLLLSLFGFVLTFVWPAKPAPRLALIWHLSFLLGFGAVAVLIRYTSMNQVEGVYAVLQVLMLFGFVAWARLVVRSVVKFGEER